MNKRIVVGAALLGVTTLAIVCALLWRNMSRKYIARWNMPIRRTVLKSSLNAHGNVCIVQPASGASEPLICANVDLFPGIYLAIGVDENRIIKWQDENGFDSGGTDRTGALLAPGYPIFSRLAWALIDAVDLQGDDLSGLLAESKRISEHSNDPVVRANLDRLSALAARAQQESKVLRFLG